MRAIVIGFGSRGRKDDAAGLEVADLVDGPAAVAVGGNPLAALDCWAGYERAILVDAMQSGRPAGTIERIDLREVPPPCHYVTSHSIGPVEVIALGRALHRLPPHVELIGIEVAEVGHGHGLSPDVQAAVRRLVEELHDA